MKLLVALLIAFTAAVTSPAVRAQTDELARAAALNDQGLRLYQQGRYAEAEPAYQRALAIREQALGPEHPEVANSLSGLGALHRAQGRYPEAEPPLKRALAIYEKALGPDHPFVAASLNNLAALYRTQGRYAEAEPPYKRALAINEKRLGPDHPTLATSLNNLALLYKDQGRYTDAEPAYKRALAIREKALGSDHPEVATSLNNLAALYRSQGRYADAEAPYNRALAIREKALGPDHPDVAASLNNLALLYRDQGRYAEAEPPYERALAIREKALGPDHPDVATSLSSLAGLYKDQGRYAEAEPPYKRALAISEKALGPEHPSIATGLSNLALLHQTQGRYAEAEPSYRRALAISEKAFGPEHPLVASNLNNLAGLYRDQRRYAEAEPLFTRALAIREKALGPDHANVAISLNNLAGLYRDQGRYAEAEALLTRALPIREKAFGPDHPSLATSLNSLAALHQAQGRSSEAEPLFKRALAIREKALGPDHPSVALSLNSLAGLYQDQGDLDAALPVSTRAVEIMERHLRDSLGQRSGGGLSEQRRSQFYFLQNIALIDAAAAKDRNLSDAPERSFRVAQLAHSSSAGEAVAGMAARFAAGSDALAAVVRERQDLADRWRRLDASLTTALTRPPMERNAAEETGLRAALTEAGERLDALDARISAEFPQYAELSAPQPLTAEAAQSLLGPDEALLVYLVDEKQSWLWALRRDRIALHRIEVGANQLKSEAQALRQTLDPAFNPRLKPFPATRAYELHQKILAPATALLAGAKHVFIVPHAALESLPIGVLVTKPPKDDPDDPEDHRDLAWFARDHAVTVLPSVGSLRALRLFTSAARASKPFLGIGDPTLEGQPGRVLGVQLASLFRGAVADVDAVRKLDPLPETADELRAVAKSRGAVEADLLLADRATEPQIRARPLDLYQVVHFATHGLVVGEMKGLAEPALVLTPPAQATPDDDGLLTASKVATLKLNADWVVLSACNTAAGDGAPGAGGLSGLAKAFFYAGARSLLVSHWSAPSEATVKLVTGAFDALGQEPGIGRAEALRRAQMAMLDRSAKPEFVHPLFWAAFVLAGEGGAGR